MKVIGSLTAVCCLALATLVQAGSATWSINPGSNDWDTATNWMPATIPNGIFDIATFGTSTVTNVSVTATPYHNLASLRFDPGADAYTISASGNAAGLQFAGDGIVNNSGATQEFVATDHGLFDFYQSASCGDLTNFTILGGMVFFEGEGSASTAHFTVSDSTGAFGDVEFFDSSTAANATFDIGINGEVDVAGASSPSAVFNVVGGIVAFQQAVNAGESIIDCSEGGQAIFTTIPTAPLGSPQVTAHGATSSGGLPAQIYFSESATADHGVFIVEGGTVAGAEGAALIMKQHSSLQNATVTLTGGSSGASGGSLSFQRTSDGGKATVVMTGNAVLNIRNLVSSSVAIGSLAGEGSVYLGANTLTIGSNNLSTTFSGVIQDDGGLTKTGSGTLMLSGANLYTGGTTVTSGALKVANRTGSATGTGTVSVNAGTLGGRGIIGGATTIGTGSGAGAFLEPSVAARQSATTTIQSLLTFKADGSYTCKLDTKKARADEVVANGVTIESGAQFNFSAIGNKRLPLGSVFVALSNTSASAISGTFANLPDGSTLSAGKNKYQASYSGGDGNELTLTVVP